MRMKLFNSMIQIRLQRSKGTSNRLDQRTWYTLSSGFCALCILLGTVTTASGQGQSLQWPASVEKGVTSSFGEWRPGHVHAGTDVKTWGRIGVPLLAVEDGYIQRVRTSPWGYGKAVYLKLDDGRLAVYAHMDRFTPEIEDLIVDAQLVELHYSVDIWPEPDVNRVKRGDIIGYSGTTGSSAPHLHFELRDVQNRPINPLRSGLQVPDTTPPVIQFLIFRPVGPESRVEKDIQVRRFGLTPAGGRTYRLRGRPEVEGTIAIGAAAYDQMDGVWNRFSPYRLVLEIDGNEVFEVRYDEFSYLQSELIALDRDYRYMIREGARAHTLYRQPGNELTFYGDYEQGEGYLRGFGPGIHQLKLTIADANGNESVVEGEVLWNRTPQINLLIPAGMSTDEKGVRIVGEVSDPDSDPVHMMFEAMRSGGDVAERSSRQDRWTALPDDAVIADGGTFELDPGVADSLRSQGGWLVRFKARDRWESETVSPPLSLGEADVLLSGGLSLAVERYEGFLQFTARTGNPMPAQVFFTVNQGELDPVILPGVPNGRSSHEAIYPLRISSESRLLVTARLETPGGRVETASTEEDFFPLPVDDRAVFESPETGLRIEFPAGSVYENHWIDEASSTLAQNRAEQELIPLSRVCNLGPQDILFRGNGSLSMPVSERPDYVRPEQIGLYTHNGGGDEDENGNRWFYLGGELDGDLVRIAISGLGPFAVLADTTRPELILLSPRDGSVLRSDRPRIQYEIDDNATGISDESQIVLRLNGTQVVAQYDPQRDRLTWQSREPLEPGEYWLLLEVTDGAGNTGRINSRFTVQLQGNGR
ncbi:peptidoglycan DD-metalloendopeptidase family protein [Gemmatimonadota bacterium]